MLCKNEGFTFICKCTNELIVFDYVRRVISKRVLCPVQNIEDVCFFHNIIYILNEYGEVYAWNQNNHEVKMCMQNLGKFKFGKICINNNRVWLLPNFGDTICCYDINFNRILKKIYINETKEDEYLVGKFPVKIETAEYIIFSMYAMERFFYIKKNGEGCFSEHIRFSLEEELRYKYCAFDRIKVYEHNYSLQQYINLIFENKFAYL